MTDAKPVAREDAGIPAWKALKTYGSHSRLCDAACDDAKRCTCGYGNALSDALAANAIGNALVARVRELQRERTDARLEAESFRSVVVEWRGKYDAAEVRATQATARADALAEALTIDLVEIIGWCEARAQFADRGTPFANGQKSGFAATADYLGEKLKAADAALAAARQGEKP